MPRFRGFGFRITAVGVAGLILASGSAATPRHSSPPSGVLRGTSESGAAFRLEVRTIARSVCQTLTVIQSKSSEETSTCRRMTQVARPPSGHWHIDCFSGDVFIAGARVAPGASPRWRTGGNSRSPAHVAVGRSMHFLFSLGLQDLPGALVWGPKQRSVLRLDSPARICSHKDDESIFGPF